VFLVRVRRRFARLGAFLPLHSLDAGEGSVCPSMCRCRDHTEPLADLKNAPSRASRRTGTPSPAQSTRLGSLNTLGRVAFGGSPCLRNHRLGALDCEETAARRPHAVFALPHPLMAGGSQKHALEFLRYVVDSGFGLNNLIRRMRKSLLPVYRKAPDRP